MTIVFGINGRDIRKTVYNDRLLPPDSYTVRCAGEKAYFKAEDKSKVADWILNVWDTVDCHAPAYVYFNIDWDSDDILYCKYELADEFFGFGLA